MNNFIDTIKIELKRKTPKELSEKICELVADNIIKDNEIERLNNDIKVLLKENENKEKVIKAQDNIIKEVRELLNQEWYSVLRKETIRKVREILDKVGDEK